jgi:hypothetical protein
MRLAPLLVLTALGLVATALLSHNPASDTRLAGPRPAGRLPAPGTRRRMAGDGNYVRPAGPEEMRAPPARWDPVDEAADETFPASDATARY